MIIKNIELKNFRNYKDLKLSFDEGVNLILGHNAQGKTNLIEAIYMSSMGKSFRTINDRELIKFEENNSIIKVFASKMDFDVEIEIEIEKKGSNSTLKRIKKDKKTLSKTSELIKNILIVIFSPEDLKLVKDEPEKRRRFLDRELCQISPLYYEKYSNYRRVLKQRNNYLKENDINREMLDIWDDQIVNYGSNIIKLRKSFVKKLSDISGNIHNGITNGEETIKIEYEPNVEEDIFFGKLKEKRERDIENRTTSVGPHRDDIGFYVNGIDMRSYGSQGQQRTCALSLKLAELSLIKEETDEDPILLLDDVMSELDLKRQEFLIKTLSNNQLFITTTDIDKSILGKIDKATIYSVSNGSIEVVR